MRILAFAYACEPGKGSEPGSGWTWVRMIARLGEVWVITRANNREAIEAAVDGIPERDRLHFVYVDLPPWARLWKRGQRGIRLYYLLWQLVAVRTAKRLERAIRFDLLWHLTLANVWLGSALPLVRKPFVYGPVGGGTGVPLLLLPELGLKGIGYEAIRSTARTAGRYLNPLSRLAWRRASIILVQNPETQRWLPRRYRARTALFPNAVFDGLFMRQSPRGRSTEIAFFAGRLLPWKGARLAIRTLKHLPGWRLMIIGEGPDESRLRRIAKRSGLFDRVTFIPTLPRDELLRRMRETADVLLYPSFHDAGPWVVGEAVTCGLPVVCLNIGGPPVLGGHGVSASTPAQTARALAAATMEVATQRGTPSEVFEMHTRLTDLSEILASRGLLPWSGGRDPVGDLGSGQYVPIATDFREGG